MAQSCLPDIMANETATCAGDSDALHQMHIALMRLRTLVSFFSPVVSDPEWARMRRELKWLSGYLGAARDMDVLMMQIGTSEDQAPKTSPQARARHRQWTSCHRRVATALKSQRHQRLIRNLSDWIENSGKTAATGKHGAEPISAYSARRLARWRRKLLRKSRRLESMSVDKLHRLRIATKKLRYAMEFFGGFVSPQHPGRKKAMLKHLRKAQESLGSLNDAERIRSLTDGLMSGARAAGHRSPEPIEASDSGKNAKRLLQVAAVAYRKIEEIKPF